MITLAIILLYVAAGGLALALLGCVILFVLLLCGVE